MRLIYTLSFILISSLAVNAQNLTGIWRGTFEQNTLDPVFGKFSKEAYKYEVQINQQGNGALEGVTYSYLTTIFYGKASLKGRLDKKNKTITIKETFLIEVKSTGKTDPCLMTCYLDYKKNGKIETLIGTYSSINLNTKKDCGNGTVYLEKVEESDFEKEDFLNKSISSDKKINAPRKLPSGKNFEADRLEEERKKIAEKKIEPKIKPAGDTKKSVVKNTPKVSNLIPKPVLKTNNNITKQNTKKITPKFNKPIQNKVTVKEALILKKDTTNINIKNTTIAEPEKPKIKLIEPTNVKVLTERENKLATTVIVDSKEINIEFYDNGEIDNDSISVYLDNKLVINNERLSTKPITLNLKFDEQNNFYELITVAENLGDIPPNTALMVINYGRKREEVFLTSDDRKNAKVIIKYKPN